MKSSKKQQTTKASGELDEKDIQDVKGGTAITNVGETGAHLQSLAEELRNATDVDRFSGNGSDNGDGMSNGSGGDLNSGTGMGSGMGNPIR